MTPEQIQQAAMGLVEKHGADVVIQYLRMREAYACGEDWQPQFNDFCKDAHCSNTNAMLLEAALLAARAKAEESAKQMVGHLWNMNGRYAGVSNWIPDPVFEELKVSAAKWTQEQEEAVRAQERENVMQEFMFDDECIFDKAVMLCEEYVDCDDDKLTPGAISLKNRLTERLNLIRDKERERCASIVEENIYLPWGAPREALIYELRHPKEADHE